MTKNKASAALFLAATLTGGSAQAVVLDLTTFTPDGVAWRDANFAHLRSTASLSGVVYGLTSFDWEFRSHDLMPFNDYGYVSFNGATPIVLSDVATVGDGYKGEDEYKSSGWQTYNIATPFSGTVKFGVNNYLDDSFPSDLYIQNVTAVPEPEEYAMMMAGIPLVGWQIRRKQNKSAPVVA